MGHPAWSPRPIAHHVLGVVVAPTTRVERHVIAPHADTGDRFAPHRRLPAHADHQPQHRPALRRSHPLLRLLSRGTASGAGGAGNPPRFLDPRPRNVPDRARETPPEGEGTATRQPPAGSGRHPLPTPSAIRHPTSWSRRSFAPGRQAVRPGCRTVHPNHRPNRRPTSRTRPGGGTPRHRGISGTTERPRPKAGLGRRPVTAPRPPVPPPRSHP